MKLNILNYNHLLGRAKFLLLCLLALDSAMTRIYGEDQRIMKKKVCDELIDELNLTYLNSFQTITEKGFGDGVVAELTQLFLMSRDVAINTIKDGI